MSCLLNAIYGCLLLVASPWLMWRYLRWGKNRRGWSHKLLGWVPRRDSEQACVWFHAVSVGEVNLLAPIIVELRNRRPDIEIAISTTTETGYDLALQKYPDHLVFFFPMDFTWAIQNALSRVRPSLIVLAELEVWPNFIRCANRWQGSCSSFVRDAAVPAKCGVPIAIANGRLSESSFMGYRRFRGLLASTFGQLDLVLTQNESYANRFQSLGCPASRVEVTGSVKFDGVQTDRRNPGTQRLAALAAIDADEKVFLAGSTQLEEDLLAARAYRELVKQHDGLRLVLAPRHPERCKQLVRTLSDLGLACQLRSELDKSDLRSTIQKPVLVIDVVGELGAWWGAADAAYVGGSMGRRGGQNMIEPAAYGIPVSFGPNTDNFKEIVDQLLGLNAAVVVRDQSDLYRFVERTLEDSRWANEIGSKAQNVVLQHHGAAEHSVRCLLKLMPHWAGLDGREAA